MKETKRKEVLLDLIDETQILGQISGKRGKKYQRCFRLKNVR